MLKILWDFSQLNYLLNLQVNFLKITFENPSRQLLQTTPWRALCKIRKQMLQRYTEVKISTIVTVLEKRDIYFYFVLCIQILYQGVAKRM